MTKIAPPPDFRFWYRLRDCPGLFPNLWGELEWEVVLADKDLDIHAEIAGLANQLQHAASGFLGRNRETGNLYVYHSPL